MEAEGCEVCCLSVDAGVVSVVSGCDGVLSACFVVCVTCGAVGVVSVGMSVVVSVTSFLGVCVCVCPYVCVLRVDVEVDACLCLCVPWSGRVLRTVDGKEAGVGQMNLGQFWHQCGGKSLI